MAKYKRLNTVMSSSSDDEDIPDYISVCVEGAGGGGEQLENMLHDFVSAFSSSDREALDLADTYSVQGFAAALSDTPGALAIASRFNEFLKGDRTQQGNGNAAPSIDETGPDQ